MISKISFLLLDRQYFTGGFSMKNKKIIIVGKGAVGNAIYNSIPKDEAYVEQYNSSDVHLAYGACPDLLIYAGVPGVKWKAEEDPVNDRRSIRSAFLNIQEIKPDKCVLISSIDAGLSVMDEGFSLYGLHRKGLEDAVLKHLGSNAVVIRLPALAGDTVYKNIWYDINHPFPRSISKKSQIEWLNHLLCKLKAANYYIEEVDGKLMYNPSMRAWKQGHLGWFLTTHPHSKMLWLDINDLGEQLVKLTTTDIWGKTLLIASVLNDGRPALLTTEELYYQMTGEHLPICWNLQNQSRHLDELYAQLYKVDYSAQLQTNELLFVNSINFEKKRGDSK